MKSVLLLLCLVLPAYGQPGPFVGPMPRVPAKAVPKAVKAPARGVSVPEEVKVKPGRLARVEASSSDGKAVRWINVFDDLDLIESETGRWAIVSSPKPGRYKLACYSDGGGPPSYVTVVVDGEAPKPPPDPKPDDPPKPDPKPVGGLRVLVVYESAELASMPEAQQGILYGKQAREAMDAACEADGKVKGWRIFDKDVDAKGDTKGWAELLARPRTALPWVVMTRGGVPVHEGPLPADVPAFLALIASKKGGR